LSGITIIIIVIQHTHSFYCQRNRLTGDYEQSYEVGNIYGVASLRRL